jgi:hypothetical protein
VKDFQALSPNKPHEDQGLIEIVEGIYQKEATGHLARLKALGEGVAVDEDSVF